MKIDVLLGLQWGDEGKGKIVDVLTPQYDVICRFQGGPNAGHSLEFNQIKHVLHTIPSGIFRDNVVNIIGNGVVIDPAVFKTEIEALQKLGVDVSEQLLISQKAHLILPSHRVLDAASEAAKGKTKIGSTLKGIGPAYMDKTGRNGLRVGDIVNGDFKEKYEHLLTKHRRLLRQYNFEYRLDDYMENWFEGVELLKSFQLIESEYVINESLRQQKRILAEGAQGTLLDIDFGSFPYVTSSNTICAGACSGLGVAPNNIGEVFGIFKAYCTRVGSGPFPTELEDETGEKIREYGNEFGATTGRERRCGWLDLVALKYAVMLNGVTSLIMTKADVLSPFDTIKVGVAYQTRRKKEVRTVPYDLYDIENVVYKEFEGWKTDISNITDETGLPPQIKDYISFIEKEVGVPVHWVSVGPDRTQIISR